VAPSTSSKPAKENNKGAPTCYKNKNHYQQVTALELADDPGKRISGRGARRQCLFLCCAQGHLDSIQAPSQAPDLHHSG